MKSSSIPVSRAEVYWHPAETGHETAQEVADAIGEVTDDTDRLLTLVGQIRQLDGDYNTAMAMVTSSQHLRRD